MTNWVSRPDMTFTVHWALRVKNRVSNHGALRPQKSHGLLGTGERGVVPMISSSQRSDPQTEEAVSRRQNNKVEDVGTPPVTCNSCTSLIAVSTVSK